MDVVTRVCAIVAVGLLAAGCDDPHGTVVPGATDRLSFGIPVSRGKFLTLDQEVLDFTHGRGVVIESIAPLALEGNARYVGGALLKPPRVGFGSDISNRFPHLYSDPPFVSLPYTLRAERGSLAVALGFHFPRDGVTGFSGIEVRYREHGKQFVATLPLAARLCVPFQRWAGRCDDIPTSEIPEAGVRRA